MTDPIAKARQVGGESDAARAARYEDEGLNYRKNGELDRRFERTRFILAYRAGKNLGPWEAF